MFPIAPDDTLARARHVLSNSKIRDLRRLAVLRDGERIVLSGRVSSYYHMQLAQKLVRGELGDVIENRIDVA
jgi:hypothetical protein